MRISDWSSDVCSSDLVIELGDEIIVEIVRHAAVIVANIAGDATVLRVHLDHRSAVERVEDDVRVVALGEGEAELRGPLGGRHFGGHIVIGEIDLVRIRSEEHTSELQSLMRISYAVFCLKKKIHKNN